jgi:hypothetical protein
MGGLNPRDGRNTSRLENSFGCLGKPVNGLGPNCYLTPPQAIPLLVGVNTTGFAHRPGFEIKNLPNFLSSTKFYAAFSFLPGGCSVFKTLQCRVQCPDCIPISAIAPAFAGYFLL